MSNNLTLNMTKSLPKMLNTVRIISALTDFLAAGRHKKLDIGHTIFTCKWVMAKVYSTLAKMYQITHPEDAEQH